MTDERKPGPPGVEKLSELSAYAYGFSDKKPGWTHWLIQAVIAGGAVGAILGWWGRP